MRRKTREGRAVLGWLVLPVAAVLALVVFAGALDSLTVGRSLEDRQQMERALRQGCVSCYAVEGRYPPDLDYLKEHYGLQINEESYTVVYTAIAPNLMPDITVLERKQ